MVQFSDLDAIVRSREFQQKIQRSLGSSTVALVALLHDHGRERLDPAGTGTLVVIGRRHYILTAAHVWDVLKSALKLGITLIDNRDHKTWIDTSNLGTTTRFTME